MFVLFPVSQQSMSYNGIVIYFFQVKWNYFTFQHKWLCAEVQTLELEDRWLLPDLLSELMKSYMTTKFMCSIFIVMSLYHSQLYFLHIFQTISLTSIVTMLYPSDSVLLLDFLSRVWISRKGIVKCDVFGPISYVRWRDEHLAVGFSSITKTCLCSGQAALQDACSLYLQPERVSFSNIRIKILINKCI